LTIFCLASKINRHFVIVKKRFPPQENSIPGVLPLINHEI
jgi:hypothetical protein